MNLSNLPTLTSPENTTVSPTERNLRHIRYQTEPGEALDFSLSGGERGKLDAEERVLSGFTFESDR